MKSTLLLVFIMISALSLKANQPFYPEQSFEETIVLQDTVIIENLQDYRKARHKSKLFVISGYSLTLLGNSMVFFAATFPFAYPMIVVGGATILVGYFIDWRALNHLKFDEYYE